MQYLREIYTLLTDMNMIEEEIQSQAHRKEEEGSLGSILGPSAEERDGPGGDAYLKLILLKISKDFHTIKGCLLVLTAISVIGIIWGLLSFLF